MLQGKLTNAISAVLPGSLLCHGRGGGKLCVGLFGPLWLCDCRPRLFKEGLSGIRLESEAGVAGM